MNRINFLKESHKLLLSNNNLYIISKGKIKTIILKRYNTTWTISDFFWFSVRRLMFSRLLSFLASFSASLLLINVLESSLVFLMSSLSFCLRSKDSLSPFVLLIDENLYNKKIFMTYRRQYYPVYEMVLKKIIVLGFGRFPKPSALGHTTHFHSSFLNFGRHCLFA